MEQSSLFLIGKFIHLALVGGIFLFALFVFSYNPKRTENRLTLLVCGSFSICLAMTAAIELSEFYLGRILYIFPTIEFVCASFAQAFSLHFIVYQCHQMKKYKPLLICWYVIAVIFSILGLYHAQYSNLYVENGLLVREFSLYFALYGLYTFVNLILAGTITWKTYRTTHNIKIKKQLQLFLFSFVSIGSITFLIGFFLPYVMGITEAVYFVSLSSLGFIFMPYATIRYQYLDVKTAFHYTLFWLSVILLVTAPLILVPLYIQPKFNIPYPTLIWGILCVAYILILQKTVFPLINRITLRKKKLLQEAMNSFIYKIDSSDSLESLQTVLFRFIRETIHTQDMSIILLHSDFTSYFEESRAPVKLNQPIETLLKRIPSVLAQKEVQELHLLPKNSSTVHELAVITKLEFNHHDLGVIIFTEKKTFKPYDFEDLRFISDITKIVSSQINKINQLSKMKKVTSEIVHELKNTSSGLKGLVAELLSKENLTPEEKEMMNDVSTEMSKLYSFSRKHLSLEVLNKMDTLQFKKTPLSQLVYNATIPHKIRLKEKGIEIDLKFSPSIEVFCDSTFMEVVLINLFENAIKFLDKKKNIEVYASEDNNQTTIEVRDYGPGISKKEAPVLETQWLVSEGSYVSSGLGLPLCKKIIQKHKGSLSISHYGNQGTSVTVEIPKEVLN
ncbi:MAG: hypothetical protein HRT90_04080 [Candidatus Margulisbacteria bacterium]|nr:hypothetical protein [Candidatus Margulisiibacteriota bacterium]